jgi:histidinol-phosphate aminotransferase
MSVESRYGTLPPRLARLIRQDVQSMHAYAVQDSAGLVKLDAMENPHRLPADLQANWASAWARWR